MNAFKATDEEFIAFISTLVPFEEEYQRWTWEERRDFLNWCLDEGVLVIQDGRLIPNPAAVQEEVKHAEEVHVQRVEVEDMPLV